jgi:hypothetical protein
MLFTAISPRVALTGLAKQCLRTSSISLSAYFSHFMSLTQMWSEVQNMVFDFQMIQLFQLIQRSQVASLKPVLWFDDHGHDFCWTVKQEQKQGDLSVFSSEWMGNLKILTFLEENRSNSCRKFTSNDY